MIRTATTLKPIVAATWLAVTFSLPAAGQEAPAAPAPGPDPGAAELLDQLAEADTPEAAERIGNLLRSEWSKSGSPTMDLLLERGREALEEDEFAVAVEHFTALIDHAPGFAEGWHGRAMAHYRLDRLGPAMDDLQRALTLNPNHFGAMEGVGAILERTGYKPEAYRVYERVLAIHPHYPEIGKALKRLEREVNGSAL